MSGKSTKVSELKKGDLVKTGSVWREVKSNVPVDKNGTEYAMELEGATPVNFPSLMTFEKHVCAQHPLASRGGLGDLFNGPYNERRPGPYDSAPGSRV